MNGEVKHTGSKINKLPGCLTGLCNIDIDRINDYFIGILKVIDQQADQPYCPHGLFIGARLYGKVEQLFRLHKRNPGDCLPARHIIFEWEQKQGR